MIPFSFTAHATNESQNLNTMKDDDEKSDLFDDLMGQITGFLVGQGSLGSNKLVLNKDGSSN